MPWAGQVLALGSAVLAEQSVNLKVVLALGASKALGQNHTAFYWGSWPLTTWNRWPVQVEKSFTSDKESGFQVAGCELFLAMVILVKRSRILETSKLVRFQVVKPNLIDIRTPWQLENSGQLNYDDFLFGDGQVVSGQWSRAKILDNSQSLESRVFGRKQKLD